jgi:SAM-dependent methyltransferase
MSMTIPPALEESSDSWDRHARRDPLWAILSDSEKKGRKWDLSRFFEAGVNEIESLWYELDSQGIVVGRGAALDFGCGVGRLTQALAPHFDRVTGVDISACMQELATRVNRFSQIVSYVRNVAPDLKLFPDNTFDFIVSNIVLQHIRPDIALSYVTEFCRVLKPRGLSVF